MTTPLGVLAFDRRQLLAGLAAGGAALFAPSILRAQAPVPVKVAYGSVGYTWAVPYVAEAGGYWKDQNVDLTTASFDSGRDAMQALLTGAADFSASTDTPLVFAALNGLKPLAVVNYSRYSRDMRIAVRSDAGIDPKNPASLKGRRIGTPVGTSGQYLLAKYLELAGLKPQDVTVVNVAPGNLATTLARGDIDGFAWSSQAVAVADKQTGGKVVEMTLDGIEPYFQSHQLFLTTDKVLKEKPEVVTAAIKALYAAENRINSDPNWPNLIAERIKTPPEQIRQATSTFVFKLGFDQRFLDDLVSEANWAIAANLGKPPQGDLRSLLRGLIADGPTKALLPERVTLS
ncbi:ABC transporter substrate-binding protein [Ancylobacter oerskovii]|uniref:ABC transporter substrate-binding protein n=1 Tax=Ancylobacter oerskovii TaxID=459519 RepID=A0ABW4YZW0_9HYPH|nr:NrtA/SsuA/CpmA family ABC transporter substrate-binding protein [Ancylobacter oerskovii]MBS7543879.1 NrtA/SsuA/CpmA family ABC transporter substrate-binding protein [Ancylobacter oerskovii]